MKENIANQPKADYTTYLYNIWIFIPFVFYMAIVSQYAVNIPYMDDYDAILKFLNNFKIANFSQKLALLVSQHNEHRILAARIVYALYYSIFGNINFRNLIFIENIQLLVIFIVMVHFIKKAVPKYWNVVAFILGLALFDINNYENADFAMAGMTNYGINMLFLLGILCYEKSNRKLLPLAALLQALCIFSSGNGVIAAFFIVLYTIFTKDKIKIITSAAVLLIFSPMYFIHYHPGETAHGGKNFAKILPYFLHTVGAHFSNDYGIIAGLIMLGGLLALIPFKDKFNIPKSILPFLIVAGYIFASLAIVAVFRYDMKTENISFYSSRYFFYSHLLFGIIFALLMVKLQGYQKALLPVALAGVVLGLIVYKSNYKDGEDGFKRADYFLENADYFYIDRLVAHNIAVRSCELGIYCIDDERTPTLVPPQHK